MRRAFQKKYALVAILLLCLGGLTLWWSLPFQQQPLPPSQAPEQSIRSALGTSSTDTGYAKAIEPIEFRFPADHGAHEDFRSEWWYITGNVQDASGRPFGYQFTIFRNALTPGGVVHSPSRWKTNQVALGHFALSDIQSRRFYSYERYSRMIDGLAGAQADPFRVWIYDWELSGDTSADGSLSIALRAQTDELALDLRLQNLKPMVLQGNRGLSQKGPQPGNASYYYSYTRLDTTGSIRLDQVQHQVRGASWFDREWSTSVLDDSQVGWDWFALQLDDGRELMYYRLRQSDGSSAPQSAGVLVETDGRTTKIAAHEVVLSEQEFFESTRSSNSRYPIGWELRIAKLDLKLRVQAAFADQEMRTGFRYWEGAVQVAGQLKGEQVEGRGYLEMTGY